MMARTRVSLASSVHALLYLPSTVNGLSPLSAITEPYVAQPAVQRRCHLWSMSQHASHGLRLLIHHKSPDCLLMCCIRKKVQQLELRRTWRGCCWRPIPALVIQLCRELSIHWISIWSVGMGKNCQNSKWETSLKHWKADETISS